MLDMNLKLRSIKTDHNGLVKLGHPYFLEIYPSYGVLWDALIRAQEKVIEETGDIAPSMEVLLFSLMRVGAPRGYDQLVLFSCVVHIMAVYAEAKAKDGNYASVKGWNDNHEIRIYGFLMEPTSNNDGVQITQDKLAVDYIRARLLCIGDPSLDNKSAVESYQAKLLIRQNIMPGAEMSL